MNYRDYLIKYAEELNQTLQNIAMSKLPSADDFLKLVSNLHDVGTQLSTAIHEAHQDRKNTYVSSFITDSFDDSMLADPSFRYEIMPVHKTVDIAKINFRVYGNMIRDQKLANYLADLWHVDVHTTKNDSIKYYPGHLIHVVTLEDDGTYDQIVYVTNDKLSEATRRYRDSFNENTFGTLGFYSNLEARANLMKEYEKISEMIPYKKVDMFPNVPNPNVVLDVMLKLL